MSDIRVLISGASIAGPALAHWLQRRGAEVTVVEQHPGLRPGGQAVDARGVAKEAIRRMGLDEAVRAVRTDTAGAYTVDVDGNVLETHSAEDFDSVPLLGEAQVVVVRKGHPLLRRKSVSLHELVRWPWLLQPPGSPQRGRFEAALREAGIRERLRVTETASPIAMTALLEHSDMAAVMPASQAAHYTRLGLLRVLSAEVPMRVPPIYLITRRAHSLSPAAAAFVALLRPGG